MNNSLWYLSISPISRVRLTTLNINIVVAAGFGESTKPGKDGKLGKLLG